MNTTRSPTRPDRGSRSWDESAALSHMSLDGLIELDGGRSTRLRRDGLGGLVAEHLATGDVDHPRRAHIGKLGRGLAEPELCSGHCN
jgi:YD repeat-containing protein